MIRASAGLAGLSAIAALLSFIAQLVIARQFGAGAAVDAYLVAASAPLSASGIAAAILTFSVMPELVRRASADDFGPFARAMLLRVGVVAAVIVAAGMALAGPITRSLGTPLSGGWMGDTLAMSRLAWASGGLLVLSTYLGCVLTARDAFYWPVAVTAFPYLGLLVAGTAWAPSAGIVALPAGTLAGTAGGLAILAVRARRYLRAAEPAGVPPTVSLRSAPFAAAAISCFVSYPVIDAFWAPSLGTAALSHLGYGQRILIAAGTIVAAGPGALVVSYMARGWSADPGSGQAASLLHAVKLTFIAAAALAAVMAALATPLVALLFGHGKFDAIAVSGVARILPIQLAGMVPMLCVTILMRGFFQLDMHRAAAGLGLGWVAGYFTLSGMLSERHGVEGIALAYAVCWWTVLAGGLAALWAKGAWRPAASALRPAASVVLSAALAAWAANALSGWAAGAHGGFMVWVGKLVTAGTLGLATFAVALWLQARAFGKRHDRGAGEH